MTPAASPRYSLSRRVLHWLSAVVILWALLSGFTMALAPLPESLHQFIAAFNVATTLVFIPFFVLRLWLALRQGKPALDALNGRQQRLANAGHQAIYALVLLVLISGVLMMERPMPVYGLLSIEPLLSPSGWTHFFALLHRTGSVLLALAVAGHIAAVVKHQRQGIVLLQRML